MSVCVGLKVQIDVQKKSKRKKEKKKKKQVIYY